ncbi:MAG: hypothetical protein ABW051_03810 [Burkholderiaceae bacterium]
MSDVSIGEPGQQGDNEPTGNDGQGNKTLDPKPATPDKAKISDKAKAWPFPARPGNDIAETRDHPSTPREKEGAGS